MEKIDFAIVGGGLLGLMIARELLLDSPDIVVVVFDKEMYLGDHTSGRNSGVLHAGLYYQQDSLKHHHCLRGNEYWNSLASELGIRILRCGKYIVSKNQAEDEELGRLFLKAKDNSVPDIRMCPNKEVQELKRNVNCSRAFFSASTGIIDQSEALYALRMDVENRGGIILTNHDLREMRSFSEGFELLFSNGLEVSASWFINAAGLGGIGLRKKLGLLDLDDYYVKGCYLKSTQKNFFPSLVYPIPEKDLKGLGVHLTFDLEGNMKFGPNTEDVSVISYDVDLNVLSQMKPQINSIFPTIDLDRLSVDYSGIRPKIRWNGNLFTDFWIKSPLFRYIELLGIESPGFTAAPSLSKKIVSLMKLG